MSTVLKEELKEPVEFLDKDDVLFNLDDMDNDWESSTSSTNNDANTSVTASKNIIHKAPKCWKCPKCDTINNLLKTIQQYNHQCCLCLSPYNVNVNTIYSDDWLDLADVEKNVNLQCEVCTFMNQQHASCCTMCNSPLPQRFTTSNQCIDSIKQSQTTEILNNDEDCIVPYDVSPSPPLQSSSSPDMNINNGKTDSNLKLNEIDVINIDNFINGSCNLQKCIAVEQLINMILNYKAASQSNDICNDTCNLLLNHYLHSISVHHTEEEFESIHDELPICDIKQCQIFKRHHRRRDQIIYNSIDIKQIVNEQINDKIHCYYCHSYDIGHKITSKEQNILQKAEQKNDDACSANTQFLCLKELLFPKHRWYRSIQGNNTRNQGNKFMMNFDDIQQLSQDNQVYSYGYEYVYEYGVGNHHNIVPKKYNDFKEEMTQNAISNLNVITFAIESEKANKYHDLEYRKVYKTYILKQHLLSIMIYCNFDTLQCKFSETYRKIDVDTSY